MISRFYVYIYKKNWEILETDDDEFKKLEFESKKLELEIQKMGIWKDVEDENFGIWKIGKFES